MPELPRTPSPPDDLLRLSSGLTHPAVVQSGVTTTAAGDWALLVKVRPGTSTPVAEIERMSRGHPVVYTTAPDTPPIARPAYPERGE